MSRVDTLDLQEPRSPRESTGAVTASDSVAIRYDSHGAGDPPLVFVHGWSCDRTYWADQMRAFAPRHQVVAIDLAGHGESGDGRASWTIPSFGGDVVAVVDHLGLDGVVLIGHSMGGDVIVEAAERLAGRVRALVWVDAHSSLDNPRSEADIEAFVEPFRLDFVGSTQGLVRQMFSSQADPVVVERIAGDMSSAPPAIALGALPYAIGTVGQIRDRLPELGVPTIAINGDWRPTDEPSLRRHGVRPIVVNNVGHFLFLEAPELFNQVLTEAIGGLD